MNKHFWVEIKPYFNCYSNIIRVEIKKEVCQIYKECHIFLKGKDASALLGGCDVDWAVGCHQHLRILNSNLVVANFLQTCKSEENDPYLKI